MSDNDKEYLTGTTTNLTTKFWRAREAKDGNFHGQVKDLVKDYVRHLTNHTARSFELIERIEHDMRNGRVTNAVSMMHVNAIATKYRLINMAKNFDINLTELNPLKRKHRYNVSMPAYQVSEQVQKLQKPKKDKDDIIKEGTQFGLTHISWYDIRMFYKAMNWSKLTSTTISNSDLNHTVISFLHNDLLGLKDQYEKFCSDKASSVPGKYDDVCKKMKEWEQNGWTLSLNGDHVQKEDMMLCVIWTSMCDYVQNKNDQVSSDFKLMIQEDAVCTTISANYPMSDSDIDANIKSPTTSDNELNESEEIDIDENLDDKMDGDYIPGSDDNEDDDNENNKGLKGKRKQGSKQDKTSKKQKQGK